MITRPSPYSPGKPIEQDHQFVDQEQVINTVIRCLNRGESCSIIGGVGMGKTSILKRIKRMYQCIDTSPNARFRFIPIYFKLDLHQADSLRDIYRHLITVTIAQIKDWLVDCAADVPETVVDISNLRLRVLTGIGTTKTDEDYTAFEDDLWEIIDVVRPIVPNLKLVFLFDEMYRLEDEEIKEAVARHWFFDLIDKEKRKKERLRSYLAFIITSYKEHREQFISHRPNGGRNPLPGYDPVEPIYLQVFEQVDAYQVMKLPLKDALALDLMDEVANEIYNIVGGHPLLLQSIMHYLWFDIETSRVVDITSLQERVPAWARKHPGMYRRIGDMISENKMLIPIFELLMTEDRIWERVTLDEALKNLSVNIRYGHQVSDALQLLKSLGVVKEIQRNVYQISGRLFREWFKPLKAAQVDETNYGEEIDSIESRLKRTVFLLNQHISKDGVGKLRKKLIEELTTLGTNRRQLADLGNSPLSPGNPLRLDPSQFLINDVQRIKNYMLFDMPLQLRELGISSDEIDNDPII